MEGESRILAIITNYLSLIYLRCKIVAFILKNSPVDRSVRILDSGIGTINDVSNQEAIVNCAYKISLFWPLFPLDNRIEVMDFRHFSS